MPSLNFDYLTLSVGYILYQYIPSVGILLPFILQSIGLRYYLINGDKELLRRVIKQISTECYTCSFKHANGKEIPSGYFFSRSFAGYLDNTSRYADDERIYLICSRKTYYKIVEERSVQNVFGDESDEKEPFSLSDTDISANQLSKVENNKIKVYIRKGHFKNLYYAPLKLDLGHVNPIGEQNYVIDSILTIYKRLGRATIFIHGVSGAGKSTIGLLLAKKIKGNYCHTFNPTDPGDNFMSMISEVKDNEEEAPIVVVLEEVDDILKGFHAEEEIKQNQELPINVRNKSTWVTFLDDMIFCKNVVVILTSNTPKKDIDALDEAYLRRGLNRVHAHFSMMSPINVEEFTFEDKEKLY